MSFGTKKGEIRVKKGDFWDDVVMLVCGEIWDSVQVPFRCDILLEIEVLYCTSPPLNCGHSAQNERRLTLAPNEPPDNTQLLQRILTKRKFLKFFCFCEFSDLVFPKQNTQI